MRDWVDILRLSAEGGSFTLQGLKKGAEGGWLYSMKRDESGLADILDDEDQDLLPLLEYASDVVDDWDKALEFLPRYWIDLAPTYIHPEFKKKIWDEVNKRNSRFPHRWDRACLIQHVTNVSKRKG
jgi:hypothetical protein